MKTASIKTKVDENTQASAIETKTTSKVFAATTSSGYAMGWQWKWLAEQLLFGSRSAEIFRTPSREGRWVEKRYSENIEDDFSKGYKVRVDKTDCFKVSNRREWYLPHHQSKPNKIRRELNGAAKFQGSPLNNALLTAPDLLQSLIHILIRFRQHPYAASADIEGMFLQVGVIPDDRPSLRFLWREDPASKVAVFQYVRNIFVSDDSPTCEKYALRRTTTDNASVSRSRTKRHQQLLHGWLVRIQLNH